MNNLVKKKTGSPRRFWTAMLCVMLVSDGVTGAPSTEQPSIAKNDADGVTGAPAAEPINDAKNDARVVTPELNFGPLHFGGATKNDADTPKPSCTAPTCCNVAIPNLPMNTTRIDHLVCSKGTIPAGIGNLVNLTVLDLQGTNLDGTIPAGIGKLVKLEVLVLSNTKVAGTLPGDIGMLVKLTHLDVSGSFFSPGKLAGTIPAGIGKLVKLEVLSLYNTNWIGVIPTSIGNLVQLTYMRLDGTALTVAPCPTGSSTNWPNPPKICHGPRGGNCDNVCVGCRNGDGEKMKTHTSRTSPAGAIAAPSPRMVAASSSLTQMTAPSFLALSLITLVALLFN